MAQATVAEDGGGHALLRTLGVFGALSDQERGVLGDMIVRRAPVDSDIDLVSEGEEESFVHIIESGWCARYKLLPDGRKQILNFLVPGDFAGLRAALFGIDNHSIATLTDCTVGVIPVGRILDLYAHYPRLAAALTWTAAREEAMLADHVVRLGRRTAYERMAHLLVELLYRLQRVGKADENSYRLPVSQETLGDMLGLSVVHVNRTLRRLRKEGLISMETRAIVLNDVAELEDLGDFFSEHLSGLSPPVRILDQIPTKIETGG